MLEVYLEQEAQTIIKLTDKNRTLLIIGEAKKDFALNQIRYYDSTKKARNDYNGGELVDAFDIAKEFGAEYVFLLNMKEKIDYVEMIGVLKQYDFAYIAPVNLYMSDYFYDLNRNGRKIYYVQDYLERASMFNGTTFIVTDKHASLYEDIDAYLDESKAQCSAVINRITTGTRGNNLLFVTNNLKDYLYANVVLASVLSVSDIGQHPEIKNCDVVFDIDDYDVGQSPIIYFKNNHQTGTTVENLVNFEKYAPILKSVFVDRILKYIERTFDLTKFHGRLYTSHQKVLIEKEIEDYLESLMDWAIRAYTIDSIVFQKENIGVGRVETLVTIWPKSTTEKYRMVIK